MLPQLLPNLEQGVHPCPAGRPGLPGTTKTRFSRQGSGDSPLKNLSIFTRLACVAMPLVLSADCAMAQTQSVDRAKTATQASSTPDPEGIPRDPAPGNYTTLASRYSSSNLVSLELAADAEPALPFAPYPAASAANPERENVPYTAEWHQPPFSRIGIGADVSLLGIGIKPAIVLDEYFDARGLI